MLDFRLLLLRLLNLLFCGTTLPCNVITKFTMSRACYPGEEQYAQRISNASTSRSNTTSPLQSSSAHLI
eukprot:SAG22_NODE_667_length_8010_cov_2.289091_2_plen_69_part_00